MSTTSGPLSPLPSAPWPSLSLPITLTFPATGFPSTSDSSVAATSTRTRTTTPTHTFTSTATDTGTSHSSTTSLTQSQSASTTATSSGTLATATSSSSVPIISSTTSTSPTSTLESPPVTRTGVPSSTETASSTALVGTLAPSDDTGATGENGPTVASVEEEISHLKETRTIVIAVLSALALVAVLVAVRAVILRRRSAGAAPPAPLPQHKAAGPLLTADTPLGGAPWPFVSEWQPPQLHRLAPPPPRPHYAPRNPSASGNRASILPQTVNAWIAGAGSSSADLRSQRTPLPSPGDRHNYKSGYI